MEISSAVGPRSATHTSSGPEARAGSTQVVSSLQPLSLRLRAPLAASFMCLFSMEEWLYISTDENKNIKLKMSVHLLHINAGEHKCLLYLQKAINHWGLPRWCYW